VPRTVIGLYQKGSDIPLVNQPIHSFAALPLNYLGLKIEYYPVEDSLPDIQSREDVIGILTWFNTENAIANVNVYRKWLLKNISKGKKIVIMGNPGFINNNDNQQNSIATINSIFQILGLRYLDNWISSYKLTVAYQDDDMVNYEKTYHKLPAFYAIKSFNKNNQVYLSASENDRQKYSYDLIVTSKNGGYASEGYSTFYEFSPLKKRVFKQWYVNPFLFFKKAFSIPDFPIPDTTTQNGLRIFFAEANGSGANTRPDQTAYSEYQNASEVLYENIFKQYVNIPFTVGYIADDLIGENDDGYLRTIVRKTFSLPNISPAANSYNFVKYWSVNNIQSPNFLTHQISDSKQYLQKFTTKPIELFLWTGNADPSVEALEIASEGKLLNINGGNSIFDAEHDSIAWLSPLGITKNHYLQVYSANANEEAYTNNWTKNFHSYKFIQQTYENTESPKRLKPISLNFNMYSGQKKASITALTENINFIEKSHLFYTTTKHYIQGVQGFYSTKILKLDNQDCFLIENRGKLNTYRLSNSNQYIDWEHSIGVMGYNKVNDGLYVALDPVSESPKICFSNQQKQNRPHIISSNWSIQNFKVKSNRLSFTATGWQSLALEIAVEHDSNYEINIDGELINTHSQNKILRITGNPSPFEEKKIIIKSVLD
jgi:hypothetical protein